MDAERLLVLRTLCDTYVPAVRPPDAEAGDPTGFWGRRASDLDVHLTVADVIDHDLPTADRDGLYELLDALGRVRFDRLPARLREPAVQALAVASSAAAAGLDGIRALTLMHAYGGVDAQGRNVNWEASGYPGPPAVAAPADRARRLDPIVPDASGGAVTLEADVVVVGSGSGGGVIATSPPTSSAPCASCTGDVASP